MMTTIRPLPCPVCGREPRIHALTVRGQWYKVGCDHMGQNSWHDVGGMGGTESAAIKRWNKLVRK